MGFITAINIYGGSFVGWLVCVLLLIRASAGGVWVIEQSPFVVFVDAQLLKMDLRVFVAI